jgi:excisionase family DNA binding protein
VYFKKCKSSNIYKYYNNSKGEYMENVKNTLQQFPEILTAKEISIYLGIGYAKALHLLKFGGIPYIKIGNTFRVSKPKFETWLNQDGQIEVL